MISSTETGLILIDIQGKLARIVEGSESLIANCSALVQSASILGLPIIWLEQMPEKLGETVPEISMHLTAQKPLSKSTFNAGDSSNILEKIQSMRKTSWLVCGIEAHICVYQTALGLKDKGMSVEVVVDAVSSRNIVNKEIAVQKLLSKGVGITSVEMCLYELIKDAKSDSFKKILALIK